MNYMTKEDKTRLEERLESFKKKRRELSDRIGRARALGDLRENAEYHASKEDQGFNERKIKEIEQKLAVAVVTDDQSVPDDMVFIGATVKLKDVENGDEEVFRLVGEATGDFTADYVEVTPNSPMGLALMKSRVGETVRVDLRRGQRRYEIVEILD